MMLAKKRIFIGCSTEEYDMALKVQSLLENNFEIFIWKEKKVEGSDVFNLNESFLNDLISSSIRFDFGILIGSPDDTVIKKGKTVLKARDNVVFELGLFIGRMGLGRVAFLVDDTVDLPTDFDGRYFGMYKAGDEKSINDRVESIRQKFLAHSNMDVNFFPSTVLASVYFESFVKPIVCSFIDSKYIESNDKKFDAFKLRIVIPKELSVDINRQYDVYKKSIITESKSVKYSGRSRNYDVDVTSSENELVVIDMPTILGGVNYSIQELMTFHTSPYEYNLILQRELERFKVTLQHLINRNHFGQFAEIV